jgi:flagellar basal body-associated protein FliL
MDEAGGWLWLVIDVVLVVVLAAALGYGIVMYRNRPKGPRVDRARDSATKELYRQEERSSSQ